MAKANRVLFAKPWLALGMGLLMCLGSCVTQAQDNARADKNTLQSPWWARLVSAEDMERSASQQYEQLVQEAYQSHALMGPTALQVIKVRDIAKTLIHEANRYNPRAQGWAWEVNVIDASAVNAFCMPGGKIVVYTGLIKQLALSDDELAVVMGHEMAHALLEHSRARVAKSMATQGIARVGGVLASGVLGVDPRVTDYMAREGAGLLSLKFSREDEQAADALGLELAARVGFDPRAGIALWQKMQALSKGAPPVWLSTHPSDASREQSIRAELPKVMPLFERAQHEARVKSFQLTQ
jgi:predicted Zn-dependent protease